MTKQKKILTFGTFDGLHPGHRAFLEQAKKLGTELVTVVAQDEVVEQLKGHAPKNKLSERIAQVETLNLADQVIPGDLEQGSYEIVSSENPQIIALGYDQNELKYNLTKWLAEQGREIKIVSLEPFQPNQYKSSLLN